MRLKIDFAAEQPIQYPRLRLVIGNARGDRLLNASNRYQPGIDPDGPVRRGSILCDLGMVPLMGGQYSISFWFGDHIGYSHFVESPLSFIVGERDVWGSGRTPPTKYSTMWWPTAFQFEPTNDHDSDRSVAQ